MKIEITNKTETVEGKVEKSVVKPFGTSAHIPFGKKHTGKKVDVIVPEEARYVWVLTDAEKKKFLVSATIEIKKQGGKLEFYRLNAVKNIEKNDFSWEDIYKITELAGGSITSKVKKVYGL